MTKRMMLPAIAALLLAGCGGNDAANNTVAEPVANEAAGNAVGNAQGADSMKAVIALSDRQRNAVFIRAILDAGLKCEGVTGSERLPDQRGQATWRADCGPGNSHMISIGPDGTATISSRSD